MRRISLEQVYPGMIVAKPIYGKAGEVLLNSGTEFKPQYVKYLSRLGINYIYVQNSRLDDVEIEDVITEETRLEALSLVKNVMSDTREARERKKTLLLDDKKIIDTVTKIIDELLSHKEIIINLVDVRSTGGYTFAHCVNTCVLACITAAKLDISSTLLQSIATGTLLHDLGYAAIPRDILQKPAPLTKDEYGIVKKHPVYGYEMFKKSSLFSASAGAVLLQHHERRNGQGYPQGLKKDEINILAQVVALADVYDALISDRPYRRAYLPHQAIEMLTAFGEEHFNLDILRTFLSFIAAYPVGTHVFLNNGESGFVVDNMPGFPLRPVVRVLYEGESLAPHPSPYDLDLKEILNVVITRVIG